MTRDEFIEQIGKRLNDTPKVKGVLVSENMYRWARSYVSPYVSPCDYASDIDITKQVCVYGMVIYPSILMKDNKIKFIID